MYQLLVADDEHWIRKGIIASLDWGKYGFKVAGEAEDGIQALEIIQKQTIHLVLLDLRMPKMDGLEFMSVLELKKNRLPYVIVISGHDDFNYAKQCLKLGAADYILKPVDDAELSEAVHEAVGFLQKEGCFGIQDPFPPEANSSVSKIMDCARNYILSHFDQDLSLTKVAEAVNLHPTYFSALFHQEMGYTFIHYVTHVRLIKAKELLEFTDQPIKEIARKIGYAEEKHFYRLFKKWEGMTPKEYRDSRQANLKK